MEKVEKTDGPWTPFWSKFVHFVFVIFLFFFVSKSTNQKLYRTEVKIEENNLNLKYRKHRALPEVRGGAELRGVRGARGPGAARARRARRGPRGERRGGAAGERAQRDPGGERKRDLQPSA